MSRSSHREDHDTRQSDRRDSRMTLSQGRGGGSGSNSDDAQVRSKKNGALRSQHHDPTTSQLTAALDRSSADRPSVSEWISRLESQGVQVIPSIQSSGRWNGVSYRWQGKTVKGSALGREYTAQGLQERKELDYRPERDDQTLRQSLERNSEPRRAPDGFREQPGRETALRPADRRRDPEHDLSPDQRRTLSEIGTFRTVILADLEKVRYQSRPNEFAQDARVLREKGLVELRSVFHEDSGKQYGVVVLTKQGRHQLRQGEKNKPEAERQTYYAGFVKHGEVKHDAAIYRMYEREKQRIEADGGTIKRVVLDYELKGKVFSELNKNQKLPALEYAQKKEEIAAGNHLKVVKGRVALPDLRIEYETREGEQGRVDVELATEKYSDRQVSQKVSAGFRIYSMGSSPRAAALQDPEIVAEMLSI